MSEDLTHFIFVVPTEAQRLKKRVSWAEDTNLVSVHYFELDESERGMHLCDVY